MYCNYLKNFDFTKCVHWTDNFLLGGISCFFVRFKFTRRLLCRACVVSWMTEGEAREETDAVQVDCGGPCTRREFETQKKISVKEIKIGIFKIPLFQYLKNGKWTRVLLSSDLKCSQICCFKSPVYAPLFTDAAVLILWQKMVAHASELPFSQLLHRF